MRKGTPATLGVPFALLLGLDVATRTGAAAMRTRDGSRSGGA